MQTLGRMASEGYLIEVRRTPCGHMAHLDPTPLAARFGDGTYLIEDSPLYEALDAMRSSDDVASWHLSGERHHIANRSSAPLIQDHHISRLRQTSPEMTAGRIMTQR